MPRDPARSCEAGGCPIPPEERGAVGGTYLEERIPIPRGDKVSRCWARGVGGSFISQASGTHGFSPFSCLSIPWWVM